MALAEPQKPPLTMTTHRPPQKRKTSSRPYRRLRWMKRMKKMMTPWNLPTTRDEEEEEE